MDPTGFLSFLLAAGVGVALFVHRLAQRSSLDALDLEPEDHDPHVPRLDDTGFPSLLPWRDRDDVRRYGLRWGIDSVVYQHEERDDQGRVITPEVVYTRYSVIGLTERIPSVRAAAASGSPAFGRLLREMARVDAFPSPEGLGLAFTDHDVPADGSPRLYFQQLLDAAFVRLVGEPDTLVYLRQHARAASEHGAVCARLLLTHYPERAAADQLPEIWAARTAYPDLALLAAVTLGQAAPLFALAMGRGVDGSRDDIMQAAWQAVAGEMTATGLIEALGSASPAVFADAARRAAAAGVPDVEAVIIRIAHGKRGHRIEAAGLLAGFPSGGSDHILVEWLAEDGLRSHAAAALRARGSTAASALLVDWLDSPADADVDFALQWLADLGAADAVGPLRAFRDRWGTRGERSRRSDAAIAGILARTGAADGALTFAETSDGGLSLPE